MCERCDLIDYPVADLWRPCWQPSRAPVKVLIDDGRVLAHELKDAQRIIQQQAEAIRHLQSLERWPHLAETQTPQTPKLID